MSETISPDFPFESRFVEVKGSRMHYVEEGSGEPILFLHGNPTSSYLWRNVIPHLSGQGRCIAPDLIGFGKSDKPDIPYRIFDHAEYLDGFIEALGLERVKFVVHDWGSFLGFHFAGRHPERVSAIAFMEAVIKPIEWEDRSEQFRTLFSMFRSEKGWPTIRDQNFFVEKVLPGSIVRKLTDAEMEVYRAPFKEPESRKPTYVFPNDIPLSGEPADVVAAVNRYGDVLNKAGIPMLLLAFEPGAIIGKVEVDWCKTRFPTLQVKELGKGIHFVQEDQPHAIGQAVSAFFAEVERGG
ncbi:MAG: haloalkane dehalogenase [SAR324 cluster bacterium]|nr:haloalkane dehalogenase [SAR324 cluster bacterium]